MEEDERSKTAGSGGDGEAGGNGSGRSSPSTPINPTSSSSTDGDNNIHSSNNNNGSNSESPLHHRHQILTVPIVNDSNGDCTLYLDFDDDSDGGNNAIHANVNSSFHHHHNTITTISNSGDDNGGNGDQGREGEEDIEDTLYYDDLAPRSSWRYRINSSIRLCYRRLWACPKCLWRYIQSSRSKARQRRADIILWERSYGVGGDGDGDDHDNVVLRTRDWKRSLMLCFSASCDDTDSGITVLITFVVVWGLILWVLGGFPGVQKNVLIGGAVFLVIRIFSRPVSEYVQRQYYRRRGVNSRSAQRLRSQPIPQDSPPPPSGKRRIGASSIYNDQRNGHDDDEDDHRNNFRTSLELTSSISTANNDDNRNGVHRLFRPESPSSEDGEGSASNLPGIFMTGSEESDPAIAAI